MANSDDERAAAFRRAVDNGESILSGIEALIIRHAGQRLPFAVIVYEHDAGPSRFNFSTNTRPEIIETRLKEMLKDWSDRGGVQSDNKGRH